MLLHSDILAWFWANQYVLLLLNYVCLLEKQQIAIWFDLMEDKESPMLNSSLLSMQTFWICANRIMN